MADEFDPDKYLSDFDPDKYLDRKPEHGTLTGHLKAAGTGLRDFGATAIGGLGTLHDLAEAGASKLGAPAGMGQAALQGALPGAGLLARFAPNVGQVESGMEKMFGKAYEPQGDEKYTKAIAEMAPSAIFGTGNALRRGAETIGAGLGSETLGDFVHNTDVGRNHPWLETGARALGAVAGAYPGAKAATVANNLERSRLAPRQQELFDVSDRDYTAARGLNAQYNTGDVHSLRNQIIHDLHTDGFRDDTAPKTWRRIAELTQDPAQSANPSLSDIEAVRKTLTKVAKDTHLSAEGPRFTEDARAAQRSIDHIDEFLGNIRNAAPGHELNVHDAAYLMDRGRGNWASAMRSSAINQAEQRGTLNAAGEGTGANENNRLRQQFRNILNNPKRAASFRPEDRALMREVVEGHAGQNVLRYIGRATATGIVSGALLHFVAQSLGMGHVGEIGLMGVGYLAKKGADIGTRRAIARLGESVRIDSPLGRSRNIPNYQFPIHSGMAAQAAIGAQEKRGGRIDSIRRTAKRMRNG